jgi:hypothetical protein
MAQTSFSQTQPPRDPREGTAFYWKPARLPERLLGKNAIPSDIYLSAAAFSEGSGPLQKCSSIHDFKDTVNLTVTRLRSGDDLCRFSLDLR